MNRMNEKKDWGMIVTDASGRLVDASQDFCGNFSVNKMDLLGESIGDVIKETTGRNRKKVMFGVIFGYPCLIRVSESYDHKIYRVIVRQEDINQAEILSFLNSTDSPKTIKKTHRYSFEDIIGDDPTTKQIKELAARIATSNSTVLLTGESGTGKELFAQAIHGLSTRKNKPFVAVNCAAIPDELFESEVFGYEAGAFSGAKKDGKPGKIELAQNGTLFLDEISELPIQAQGKLLRVLQEREVERLGGTSSNYVDIRIIAATNRDLRTLVQDGKFRQDLFYRLYVFELKIPSLRDRSEDILPLAHYFINYFNKTLGCEVSFMDSKLEEWILNYEWPGNVRELKAFIERGMNMVDGDTLMLDSLYLSANKTTNTVNEEPIQIQSLEEEVKRAEINAIQHALREADGDRSLAAQKLKIHIASLYRKIAKYNLK